MFEEDLAERVDSLFCEISGGGIGPYQDMDTISMLLTGWIIFIVFSVVLTKYLYIRFVKKTNLSILEGDEDEVVSEKVTREKPNVEENESYQQNGSATTKIVETISGPKSISSNSKPPVPVRRRRVDKLGGSSLGESFDEIAAINASGPCTGSNPMVVEFVNACYEWGFTYKGTQKRSWEDIRETFINAINKTLRQEDLKNDLAISVMDFKIKDEMKINNIFAECNHPNHVKVTSDCEVQLIGEITVSSKESGLRRCKFFVDRLSGRLSTLFECEEKSAIIKLDGWPEICAGISNSSPSKNNALDPKLTEAVADRMTSAIRNCIVEIDYCRFEEFPVPAKLSPKKNVQVDQAKKFLLVKIVQGTELGLQKGCQEPYCAIELDDPPQKFQTEAVISQHPVWNENFAFNVVPGGGEILFEVYDRVGTRFLGCTIISVEDIGTEKTRHLPLKSRRMELSDQISGTLEVQFTFLDEKEFLLKSSEMSDKISSNGNLVKTTRTVFTRSPDAKSSTFAENVIKEFERKALPNANKSTLIIHAVQRDNNLPTITESRSVVQIEKLSDGSYTEVIEDPSLLRKERLKNDEVATGLEGQYGEDRGRRRTRKGDIFTSIRRRFSKGRSLSVVSGGGRGDNDNKGDGDEIFQRSVSADRQSMLSTRLGLGSARSSTSDMSGISGFSTTTFVHENSTLVVECVENRIRKYYLVPPNLAETGKWKKKGKKLHIYNDHTFVAKHLPSGTLCEICTTRLPFSLGKQGYQCRDCNMRCHKECHIRAPSYCAKTTIYEIELSTANRVDENKTFASYCSTLFGGKKDQIGVSGTNKDCLDGKDTNHVNVKSQGKPKKKKSSIFRKVTRLGKITEESFSSKERLNGDITHPLKVVKLIESPEKKKIEEPVNPVLPKSPNKETTEVETEAETHNQPGESPSGEPLLKNHINVMPVS